MPIGCTHLAKQILNPCQPALIWVGDFTDPSGMKQPIRQWFGIFNLDLERKQSVVLIVNLFQLGKQVGPQRTKQVFQSFDCAKRGLYSFQQHFRIKQCLSKQNTSSTTELINSSGCNSLHWFVRNYVLVHFDVFGLDCNSMLNVRSTISRDIAPL